MIALLGLVPIKDWLYLSVIAALVVGGLYYEHTVYEQGYTAATTAITVANEKAQTNALKAQQPVDACFAAGGNWNNDLRVCEHPAN
jgi:Tfp pilus assembly major pilin PilA